MNLVKYLPIIIALAEAIQPIVTDIEAAKTAVDNDKDKVAKLDDILKGIDAIVGIIVKAL